jgi:Ca2+-binding RTX toxin-like protein
MTVRCLVALLGLLGPLVVPNVAFAGPTCYGHPATIVGTPEDDIIHGTLGNDVIVGLGGNDTIDGATEGTDFICGDDGNDQLESPRRAALSYLFGGNGNDALIGSAAPDTNGRFFMSGGAGDDVLDGSDHVFGLEQGHVAFYQDVSGPVEVDLQRGIATGEGTDTLIEIEIVVGSQYGDTLVGTDRGSWLIGGCGDDSILGGSGDELLYGANSHIAPRGCVPDDDADILDGNGGNDVALGSSDEDVVRGGAGSDVVDGESGDDAIEGGRGDDIVEDSLDTNSVSGGRGIDIYRFHVAGTVDLIAGTATFAHGSDQLADLEDVVGSQGPDVIYGDDGPNAIQSIQGRDRIYGRGGNDVLKGGRHRDLVVGGRGDDHVSGGLDDDTCRGGEIYRSCERRL